MRTRHSLLPSKRRGLFEYLLLPFTYRRTSVGCQIKDPIAQGPVKVELQNVDGILSIPPLKFNAIKGYLFLIPSSGFQKRCYQLKKQLRCLSWNGVADPLQLLMSAAANISNLLAAFTGDQGIVFTGQHQC